MKKRGWVRAAVGGTLTAGAIMTGAVTAGAALADGGLTTNPTVNTLLGGAADAAQQPLLPGLPPVPPGVDINTAAMVLSAMIGVQNVDNGTAPIYANGAIAGMDTSLGIAFPNGGGQSTIDWALSLLDTDPALRDWVGSAIGTSGANYWYYNPAGTVGEPLTGPTLPTP